MKTAIFLVGTNASGKSTIIRTLLREHVTDKADIVDESGELVAHELTLGEGRVRLLGPYKENGPQCAGMDALSSFTAERQFEFIREQLNECPIVLLEGMRIGNQKRAAELYNEGIKLYILELVIPDEEIIRSLTERRAAKGQGPLEDTKHIFLNKKRARSFTANMYAIGANTKKVSRETAVEEILKIIHDFE